MHHHALARVAVAANGVVVAASTSCVVAGRAPMSWSTLLFELDDDAWGLLLEDDEGAIYAYATTEGRRVPCFTSLGGAQRFAGAWSPSAPVASGGTVDLRSLSAFARGAAAGGAELDDAWGLVAEVLAAAGVDLDAPTTPAAARAALDLFAAVVVNLDRARTGPRVG